MAQYYQARGIENADPDDIYLGNGVSELITMVLQALLGPGDEVLIPAPDYPLWTGATKLCGGTPVHYICDEENRWWPDPEEIEAKVTENTKALVLINPNNPTGAVYPRHILEKLVDIARRHHLMLLADEIYENITFDDVEMVNAASLSDDVVTITFSGLSKTWRVAGFRSGWIYVSGPKQRAASYLEGLELLMNMRMCANVPAQHALQAALGGYQSIGELIAPGGRLYEQRTTAHRLLNEIPGVDAHRADGALYLFLAWMQRCTPSKMMRPSSSSCCVPRRFWSRTGARSTGRTPSTSGWWRCPVSRTWRRPLRGSLTSSATIARERSRASEAACAQAPGRGQAASAVLLQLLTDLLEALLGAGEPPLAPVRQGFAALPQRQ